MTVVPARVAGVERVVVATPGGPRRRRRSRPARRGRPARGRRGRRRRRRPGDRRPGLRPAGRRPRRRSTGSSGPATPGSRPPSSRSCGEVGIDLPAGPSEGLVLAAPPAEPRRVALDLHHPGRARPRLPGHPRHDRRGVRRRGRGGGRRACSRRPRAATSSRARSPSTAGSSSPRTSTPRSRSSTTTRPEHLSVDVEPLEADGRAPPQRRARCSSGRGRRSRPATTRPARTTCCRPAAWRARPAASRVEAYGKFIQVQRITREGLAGIAATVATLAEAEGLLAHRDAVTRRFDRSRRRGADR